MAERPDYYMSSVETVGWEDPRKVWFLHEVAFDNGFQAQLIRVEPAIQYTPQSGTLVSLDTLVISPHDAGTSLNRMWFPWQFPFAVYVYRLLGPPNPDRVLSINEVEMVAWCNLYRTQWGAKRAVGK